MHAARVLVLVALLPVAARASEPPPPGLAASCGESVVLVDPADGRTASVQTGPVGWLFPAPEGILFAPDLVHGRTTVISLPTARVVSRLDGVTMPRFAHDVSDRYAVVAPGEVLVASYPDRVVLAQVDLPLVSPWRAAETPEGSLLVVLDRGGPGRAPSVVAVDLWQGRVAAAVPLAAEPGDVVVLDEPQLVVLVTAAGVTVLAPAKLEPVTRLDVPGAVALAALPGGEVAVGADSPPRLEVWRLRQHRRGLRAKLRRRTGLPACPVRVAASPDGVWLAVALASGELQILRRRRLAPVRTVRLPASPRDLVWADLALPGPALPEWSDEKRRPPGAGRAP